MLAYPNAYSFTDTHSIGTIMPSLLFTDRNRYRYAHHSTAIEPDTYSSRRTDKYSSA
jgi:hypothetical protein